MSAKPTKRRIAAKKLPPAPRGESPSRNYAALAEENFGANGFAGKSLLRSVVGAVRIHKPRNCLLAEIVARRQSIYAAILGRVMSGHSLVASAVSVGIARETVRRWLLIGLQDQVENKDTYYSRFASDIHAALAHSVGEAELAVMRRNPIEYLRTGPGRAFYQEREGYWQPVDPRLPPPVSDIEPLAEIGPSQDSDSLPPDRASAALAALRELNIIQHPEYAKQLSEQSHRGDEGAVVDTLPSTEHADTDAVAPDRSGMDRSMHTDKTRE